MAKKKTKGVDLYTNYNYYIVGSHASAHHVDEEKILNLINGCRKLLKKPYIRFMYIADKDEAHCIVYDGNKSVTRIVPVTEVETMIANQSFTK